ncbi:MAG: FAD-dependent oxidoreductase [Lachnospiraceae bacterium]|nr:FAD-dependent oxidoreductase [Lachnospiraceae bacterium]
MHSMRDVLIIGSGPAGLTAAIYANRSGLDTAVIEALAGSGGQVVNTSEIDNYPALPGINGFELGMKMREHVDSFGVPVIQDKVTAIDHSEPGRMVVKGEKDSYEAKAVVIATGANHRLLGVPGEKELAGMGVSYCAVCDGAFYRGLTTAVVGGGNVAVADAQYLSRICEKVYLIHRRDSLRAMDSLQKKILSTPNVEVKWNSIVKEVRGKQEVEELLIGTRPDANSDYNKEEILKVDGVFMGVGMIPTADFIDDIAKDEGGYIIAGEDGVTSIPGIFAAGDVRAKNLRQIITACGDGANVISSVENYLAAL